ncbi:Transposase [Solitalea koreensis]|uniref:Transposase n=1 Tax=Solitalea koreensis TaxID=543615 RepID=A0A521EN96_9SPHI|nr:Transposase [Solitalea koreensis]
MEEAKKKGIEYKAVVLQNGDTLKQLLAQSRYLLYKSQSKWTKEQQDSAVILFQRYPDIKLAYTLAQKLSWIYSNTMDKTGI